MKRLTFRYLFGGLLLSTLCLFPAIARAQVRVAPLVIEADAQQDQAQGVVDVRNEGTESFRARLYAQPFTFGVDGFEALESSPDDLTPYLTFSPRELVVEPGQTRRIRVSVKLLPSLTAGEYRSVLFAEKLLPADATGGGIVPRVGILIFVRKDGATPNLSLQGATVDANAKKIQLAANNSGNASARPVVVWTLKSGDQTIASGEEPPATLLPQKQRSLTINYQPNPSQSVPSGQYQLTGQVVWGEGDADKIPFDYQITIPGQ